MTKPPMTATEACIRADAEYRADLLKRTGEAYQKLADQRDMLRAALLEAVPFLFEYGAHQNSNCYRGSDDSCYCGLTEAQKIIHDALEATK